MLKEGQTLWMVPVARWAGAPRFVTVTKVGRKWAEISVRGYRIDKLTLAIDGGQYSSPGRCYLTKEEHDQRSSLERAWRELQDFVYAKHLPPDGVSVENIRTALLALGFRMNQKAD